MHVQYVCLNVHPGALCVLMSMWVGICACVCMQMPEADDVYCPPSFCPYFTEVE